eukprot:CAMPEP_0114129592 /NCGR_PEP_ID=MMETSP0043_2-20121206/11559_1 /TAXON_ID=464988 /ORGANISM="Hemiselmis andersenii, Strain CCMP644" /LENGTH=119 /DNA_ID=CAMNT_0001222881 /DNA_START=122 /DNA_END=481 /DNA_ORIENTATION=+
MTSGFFQHAAVLTRDGFLAASSVGFTVSKADFKEVMGCFLDAQKMYKHGCTVNGIKYVAISGNPRTIHCKIGPEGLVCCRAKNCVLVGLYRPPVMAPQAVTAMEMVADQINSGLYNVDM